MKTQTDPPKVPVNLRSLLEKMEIDFDAPVLYNPASASGPLENEPVVDDECYMGKDGQLDACADFGKCANPFHYLVLHFYIIYIYISPELSSGALGWTDPPKVPVNLRKLMEKIDKKIDYDAPVPYNPQSSSGPLDYEPVVDDECYMGKDGQLNECADFGKGHLGVHSFYFFFNNFPYTDIYYISPIHFIGCS